MNDMTIHTSPNVLDLAASTLMTVKLQLSAGTRTKKSYKDGKTAVANITSGDESAFLVSRKLFPKGFDQEVKQLLQAFNACRSVFYDITAPFGKKGDGSADGERLVTAQAINDGSFMAALDAAIANKDAARKRFADRLDAGLVNDIRASGVLGSAFDYTDYPTSGDVLAGYEVTLIGPSPLPSSVSLAALPLSYDTAQAIAANMEDTMKEQLAFSQQRLIKETFEYIETMANQMHKLNEHLCSQSGPRPKIYDSLVANVQKATKKLRTYALPDTDEGQRLIDWADRIEAELKLDRIDMNELKGDAEQAAELAANSRALATELGSVVDGFF